MKIEFYNKFFYNLIIFLLISSLLLYIFKAIILINALDFSDMFMSEHKLPVQILKINDIEVNYVNFTKAGKNRILE